MNHRPCARGLLACLALLSAAAAAQQDVYVPEELEPWRDWVLHGHEFRACPFFFDRDPADPAQAICAWPGTLELAVGATEARFTQPWTVYAEEQWVPLPGDAARWPESVTADGRPLPVLLRPSGPAVRLPPGRHVLAGIIGWEARPRTLPVPAETGLVALSVDGRRIARPERSGNALWLGEREPAPRTADALQVEVYRLVEDGVPTRLRTVLTLDVAGQMREEVIEPVLPPGFIPTALDSELPARLESNGQLRVQVRPGSFELTLDARAEDVVNEVSLPPPVHNLPEAEIWSYRSNDRLRVTVPEGLSPVDPEQVDVPHEYQDLPAFRVQPGDALTIVERSRGRSAGDDRLRLERVLWLDFEGEGFTFSDRLTGQLDGRWRLDLAAPYVLQNAVESGQNLLVTAGDGDGLTGVELRTRELNLEAYGRLDTRDAVPASGWQARLAGMSAELNLPPGQKLFAAAGADRASGTWVERWRLLDFFLVLIVTVSVARLFGRAAAGVALAALVLSWHEPGAPHWAWLNALAAIALARVAPAGRLQTVARAYRALGVALVAVLLVPFIAAELRIAIHPQLEPQRGWFQVLADRGEPAAAPKAAHDEAVLMRPPVEEVVVTGALRSHPSFARYAPNAIVQAGPGRPAWRWNTYALEWSGPVDPSRTLDLWILPRWLVSAWRIAAVLLSAAFAALLVLELVGRRWRDLPLPRGRGASSLVVALAAAAGVSASPSAGAETPSPEILKTLEQRLLEPPPCVPRCAEIVAARVDVSRESMSVELEVHAQADVAVPLPGSAAGWRPERITVDGAPVPHVYRRGDGTLWLRASDGRHRIGLAGPLPPVESIDVPFPAAPRVVTARAEGWALAGIDERRLRAGSLTLTRLRTEGEGESEARWESSRFPAFVRVEHGIELDLDWRVNTRVIRIAPEEGAITLDIPLLPGASLLTEGLPVQDGRVRVAFGANEDVVEWSATLPRRSPLTLHAPADVPWKEVWRIGVGNIWHATFEGVPESEPENPSPGARIAEFYPRGGESLTLHATRPEPTAGATLAFDEVSLDTDVGARSRTTTLELAYRSTRGAQHVVRLPEDARLLDVRIDGEEEPLGLTGPGQLTLPIVPGEHDVTVRWQTDAAAGTWIGTPAVDLGAAAGNVTLTLEVPSTRWVLATFGPRLGPAVMYWPELAAMLLMALVLGRTSLTPLATRHWLLLGLGFSTFSWPALGLVVLWLLAAGGRERLRIAEDVPRWRYNALQVAFALLSLAALFTILGSVPMGLLGSPDMHIVGNGSFGSSLRWFQDRTAGPVAEAAVFSLPLWVYKVAILAWALWLSFALLRWLPWAWRAFVGQGLWRGPRPRTATPV